MLRRKRSEIRRARAVELRPDTTRQAVIMLDGEARGQRITGLGETASYGRGTRDESWSLVEETLDTLTAVSIPHQRVAALDEISVISRDIRDRIFESRHRDGTDGALSVLAALEMALYDFAARAAGLRLSAFLSGSGENDRLAVAMPVSYRPGMPTDSLVATASGAKEPLWIDLAHALDLSDARKLIQSFADSIRADVLGREVVIVRPVHSDDPAVLGELQAGADELVPRGANGANGARIIVASGHSVESVADARKLAEAGLGAIVLDPHRVGGLTQVRDIAIELRATSPHVRCCLAAQPRVSGITARLASEAARGIPEIDYVAIPVDELTNVLTPPFTIPDAIQGDDGTETASTAGLAAAVHHVRRSTEFPRRPQHEPAYGQLAANSYDVSSLAGVKVPSHLIERAALSYGLDTVRHSATLFVGRHAELNEPVAFRASLSSGTSVAAGAVVTSKDLTRRALLEDDLPVPIGQTFCAGHVDEAVAFRASFTGSAVVKPVSGHKGIGVSTDLRTEEELRSAIQALEKTEYADDDFLIEKYITGNDYRFLVVGDRVVSVVFRRPANVVGDGRSTVFDLVLDKNLAKLKNPHMRYRLLQLDRDAFYWLGRQDLTVDDVPEAGREIRLSSTANGSRGADTIEVLDETHPSLLKTAVKAAQSVPGLDEAGIDVIGDHRLAVDEQDVAIIEVNNLPGILIHHFPLFGPPRDAAGALVERSCAVGGKPAGEPLDTLSVRVVVHGRVQGVGYERWFARRAQEHGLSGAVRSLPSGGVEATVSGPLAPVSVVVSGAVEGPSKAFVNFVHTVHAPAVEPTGRFDVIS